MTIIIFLGAVLLIISGYILIKQCENEIPGILTIGIGGIILFFAVLCWPISYFSTKAELVQFEQARTTLNESRITLSEIERAAMVSQMVKKNEWLAGQRYWNRTIFDWYIPDAVGTTPMLKMSKGD